LALKHFPKRLSFLLGKQNGTLRLATLNGYVGQLGTANFYKVTSSWLEQQFATTRRREASIARRPVRP
jgi:hypothetical protein